MLSNAPSGLCLGTFCFLWGQKQETTATWFSMFLPTREKTPAVDVMARAWTGADPANRAPLIHGLRADFRESTVAAGAERTVTAEVTDADGDSLHYDWQVVEETRDRKFGGDPEETPAVMSG